jgi:hypothetical protein
MKSSLRFWAMLTASAFGLLIAAAGCGAEEAENPLMTEQQAIMSTEEESDTSDESALNASVDALQLQLAPPRGRCWYGRNCTGKVLAHGVTARVCGPARLAGRSWRRITPPGPCINLAHGG